MKLSGAERELRGVARPEHGARENPAETDVERAEGAAKRTRLLDACGRKIALPRAVAEPAGVDLLLDRAVEWRRNTTLPPSRMAAMSCAGVACASCQRRLRQRNAQRSKQNASPV